MKINISSYKVIFIFTVFVVINLIIKLLYIDFNDISKDEPFTIYHSQLPALEIIKELLKGNNPPLYELFLHYWLKIFDPSSVSIRFPSVMFSSITSGIIFLLGHKLFNLRMGIYAASLYSISSFQFIFAHEARVYSLVLLLSTLSIYLTFKYMKSKKFPVWLILVNVMMICSHYLTVFIILAQILIIIRNKKRIKIFSYSYVLLFLMTLPLYIVLFKRIFENTTSGFWVEPIPIKAIFYGPIYFVNHKYLLVFLFFILSIYIARIFKKSSTFNSHLKDIIIWFTAPYMITYLISLNIWSWNFPVFIDRYILFTSVPFYLILGHFFGAISKNYKTNAIVFSLFFLGMIYHIDIKPYNNRMPSKTAALLKELKDTNTSIIIAPKYYALNIMYHYDKEIFSTTPIKQLEIAMKKNKIFGVFNKQDLMDLSIDPSNVIYVNMNNDVLYPENKILNYIESKRKIQVDEITTIHLTY